MNIRPYVICSFTATFRYLEQGEEHLYGFFTGEVDTWGKYTFVHIRSIEEIGSACRISMPANGTVQIKLPERDVNAYLFADEIGEIHYADEVTDEPQPANER